MDRQTDGLTEGQRDMMKKIVALRNFAETSKKKRMLTATFLGAFAKLRKATISFVISVRLSAWNNSAPTGRIFKKCEFDNIQVS
jgi:hypothetical protein